MLEFLGEQKDILETGEGRQGKGSPGGDRCKRPVVVGEWGCAKEEGLVFCGVVEC